MSFNPTSTAWTATAATQIDYFVTIGTGDLGSVMHSYVDAVGHAPMLPDYAAGYVRVALRKLLTHQLT